MLLRRDRAGKLCELSAVFLALIWKVRGNPGCEKNKMTFDACKALHPGGKVFFSGIWFGAYGASDVLRRHQQVKWNLLGS